MALEFMRDDKYFKEWYEEIMKGQEFKDQFKSILPLVEILYEQNHIIENSGRGGGLILSFPDEIGKKIIENFPEALYYLNEFYRFAYQKASREGNAYEGYSEKQLYYSAHENLMKYFARSYDSITKLKTLDEEYIQPQDKQTTENPNKFSFLRDNEHFEKWFNSPESTCRIFDEKQIKRIIPYVEFLYYENRLLGNSRLHPIGGLNNHHFAFAISTLGKEIVKDSNYNGLSTFLIEDFYLFALENSPTIEGDLHSDWNIYYEAYHSFVKEVEWTKFDTKELSRWYKKTQEISWVFYSVWISPPKLRYFFKNLAVCDIGFSATSSGVPAATISPPPSPPSGPKSMI